MSETLSREHVCLQLRRSERQIRRLIANGKLEVGHAGRVTRESLERCLNEQMKKADIVLDPLDPIGDTGCSMHLVTLLELIQRGAPLARLLTPVQIAAELANGTLPCVEVRARRGGNTRFVCVLDIQEKAARKANPTKKVTTK